MFDYQKFLASKAIKAESTGIKKPPPLNTDLMDFQRDIVRWALKKGRAAIFADCGLGKTFMQLEWGRCVPGRVLILAPLAVSSQTVKEGQKFGIDVTYLREDDKTTPLVISNYEMLEHFNPDDFTGIVLDESSILKNYTGKTKQKIINAFRDTPFRLACTATPSPNDHLELGNHAEFLGVMKSNEMIMRWFTNDSMQAGGYRLKGHAEADFWRWVTSWAVCVSKPSDLGHDDDGFILPPLEIIPHLVNVDHSRAWAKGEMFLGSSLSATDMWREKRATMPQRVEAATEIASQADGPVVLWCDTNDEADALKKTIPDAVEVRGSDSPTAKEMKLGLFSSGERNAIITKSEIAGFGLNWQHSHTHIFVGLTYSFEKFYQAIRRSYRFGQTHAVEANIIYAETEGNIVETIETKAAKHKEVQDNMSRAVRKYGIGLDCKNELMTVERENTRGDGWEVRLGDCVSELRSVAQGSIDYSIFSPPFSNLYIYSDSIADMGNSKDHLEFFAHYDYVAQGLWDATRPGRLVSVHCKDLPLYKNRDGAAGLYDFPGDIIASMERAGFTFHSRVTIWKDPVIEMQRTKNHGLLHKNFMARREVVRMGMADYVLTFRKWAEDMEDCQVTHEVVPGDYIGTDPPARWDSARDWSIQLWQKYASPVWFDIQQPNVLNVRAARDPNDEKHICPLQLDVIERCIWLYSNPGDLVFSPFTGIGSEGYQAIKMGRRFLGVELKETYYQQAIKNISGAAVNVEMDIFQGVES